MWLSDQCGLGNDIGEPSARVFMRWTGIRHKRPPTCGDITTRPDVSVICVNGVV
jgi:hypothetical protein